MTEKESNPIHEFIMCAVVAVATVVTIYVMWYWCWC
jgi:hypothetical protein